MNVSFINAIIIQGQGDNIVCEVYGQSKETGKWAGAINLYKEGFFHRTLISSNPVFDTEENSVRYMKKIVKIVRLTDFEPQTKNIEQAIGSETMEVMKKTVKAAG